MISSAPSAPPPVDGLSTRLKPVFSVVSTWVFALLPANFAPPIIAGLSTDYGLPIESAGMTVTGMTLVNAGCVLAVKPLVERGHRVILARIGICILVLAAVAGMTAATASVIVTALLVGGIGSGITIGVATAASAATPDPDRTAQVAIIANRIVVAGGFLLLPMLGETLTAVFAFVVLIGIVAFSGTLWLPAAPRNDRRSVAVDAAREASAAADRRRGVRRISWLIAVAFAAFTITEEGTYGLVQVFMLENLPGLPQATISAIFAAAIMAGLGGALAAPVALRFLGRPWSLVLLILIGTAAKLVLVFASSLPLAVAGNVVWGFAFGAIIPLVFGFAAALARSGSAVVLLNGLYILGVALGPLIATQVLSLAGKPSFGALFAAAALLCGAAIITAVRLGRRLGERSDTTAPDDEGNDA